MTDRQPLVSRRVVVAGAAAIGGAAVVAGCAGSGSSSGPTSGPSVRPTSAAPTTAAPRVVTAANWAQLRKHLTGPLALPGDPSYAQVRLTENPRYDTARPLAVASVAGSSDVATLISFAQDHAIPVSVRSGGHSYAGWSAGGGHRTGEPRSLVIDCRPLHSVGTVGTKVSVGAGVSLAVLYDAVGSAGRAVPGGSCATVGLAGLSQGGGVGVLTRNLGLTCDAVRSMRVVLADGSTVTASTHEHPDLYWALRGGGGGHLGVVTSFELATTPAPTITTFYLQWPISAASHVVPAWQAWAPQADRRSWSTLKALGGAKHPSGPILLCSGTWTGPSSGLDGLLAGLLDHVPGPAYRSSHTHGYRDTMFSFAGCSGVAASRCNTDPGGALTREAFAATSHVGYSALSASAVGTLVDRVEAAQGSGLTEAGISMDALGGTVRGVAPDATAFVHRDALMTVQYTATYAGPSPTHAAAYVHRFRQAMTPSWGHHAYVNYADPTIKDYAQAYFGANATRLASVRASYDPHRFFTQPQDF